MSATAPPARRLGRGRASLARWETLLLVVLVVLIVSAARCRRCS